ALAREKGVEARLFGDPAFVPATVNCVIDFESGGEERKRALLQRLDAALPSSAVMITSCLRFGTTHMASWVKSPERIVGFATFFPLQERKLIELAGGLRTGEGALKHAEELFQSLG